MPIGLNIETSPELLGRRSPTKGCCQMRDMERIRYGFGKCWFGRLLVAESDAGVCAIVPGDDAEAMVRGFEHLFPVAERVEAGREIGKTISMVEKSMDDPTTKWELPLDVRGTEFQQRVWKVLRKIPMGKTASYREVAERIGSPKAVRAVARACAANALAVVIPCHRVLRSDGGISGYRWGVERKIAILEKERSLAGSSRC